MMMTIRRSICRASRLVLSLSLLAGALGALPSAALGQAKEPTDGFFDVPKREGPPAWGLPEYMTTAGMGGLAIFILCKSSRRT